MVRFKVSVTVTNSGQRAGQETAILYLRDVVATLTPPGKRVKRFAKVYLEPGPKPHAQFHPAARRSFIHRG